WDDETGRHQTWSLDLGARKWTAQKPASEPEPSSSRSRNLAYLPEENLFLLELVGKDRGPEIWAYRLSKAREKRPDPPSGLEIRTQARKATLTWKAPGEVTIYRARSEKAWEAAYSKLTTTRESQFTDGDLEPGKTYFYRVEGPGGRVTGRTEPRVLPKPVVSVLTRDKVEVTWNAPPAADLAGYNLYRGTVSVATVKKGQPGAWRDNDPEYAEPEVVSVRDLTDLVKLNEGPLASTTFTDSRVDLGRKGPESADYRFAVYAYVVRAVNRMGVESGPSPYALTLPSEPENVLVREKDGTAEVRWDPSREKAVAGYLVYELTERNVTRVTPEPIRQTTFARAAGKEMRRYCVVAVDALGQEGQPSSSAWYQKSYAGFFRGEWHQ
ncbi:MAG TPA: fibronectin type III domain-containing protein, partial [Planctomycetota bacterium]|nr:fibronectin type III domain-containing protein [Planctomycetota bacterium]